MILNLAAHTITRVAFDYTLTLSTTGPGTTVPSGLVVVEGGFFWSSPSTSEQWVSAREELHQLAVELVGLHNGSITSASVDDGGELVITFDAGRAIRVPNEGPYECWDVHQPGSPTRVNGAPGGVFTWK